MLIRRREPCVVFYSARSATTGSIRDARSAGNAVATSVTIASITTTLPSAIGSSGDDAVQRAPHQEADADAGGDAGDRADRQQLKRLPRHQADDIHRRRAKGHPRAELGGPLRHAVGDNAKQARVANSNASIANPPRAPMMT